MLKEHNKNFELSCIPYSYDSTLDTNISLAWHIPYNATRAEIKILLDYVYQVFFRFLARAKGVNENRQGFFSSNDIIKL